jgi:bile acid:Na+ symporter, BASS family
LFVMDMLPRMLAFVFLITAMLSVWMQTTLGDLRSLLQSKGFLFRSLLANFVFVPIIGVVMARTLPLKPESACAFLLLACTPGGISALQFTTRLKGASLYAATSTFLLSFVAIFVSPVLFAAVHPAEISMVIPYGRPLLYIVICLILPLLAGVFVRSRWGSLAARLSKICALVSAVAFFAVLILMMGMRKEATNAVGKETVVYMLLFILISMAFGWFTGGPEGQTRSLLATVTGMRNVALCLLMALNMLRDPAVQAPLVALSALMIPPNMLLTVYTLIRGHSLERRAAQAHG